MTAVAIDPAELLEAEIAELLDGCADLALAVCAERARLQERLAALSVGRRELEVAVARAREAAARSRPVEQELTALRAAQATLRRELREL